MPPSVVVLLDGEWRISFPVVDCKAKVRLEVWCCLGEEDEFLVVEAMSTGDETCIMALVGGGECPNKGKFESSRSDSSKVESM